MLLDGPFSLRKLRLFPQEDHSPPSDFFWQGPDSKYSWFAAHLVSVTPFQCSVKSIIDNIEMNVHGCVLIKHYLSSLKFEFHIIFTGQKSVLLLFFNYLRNVALAGWLGWLEWHPFTKRSQVQSPGRPPLGAGSQIWPSAEARSSQITAIDVTKRGPALVSLLDLGEPGAPTNNKTVLSPAPCRGPKAHVSLAHGSSDRLSHL